ncbi:MFS transporter [Agromyces sp. Root1464]|uniref:MFS transporter n=1 Tax=Agromyces sp. Root1464 TaxID=1736467 RepID=UPI000B1DAE0F|nr:MFS transporter [Agromyces sp. Root1464]
MPKTTPSTDASGDGRRRALDPADRVDSVWRSRGMPALLTMTALGFAGYAVLLPVAPLWAVAGGVDAAGAGLVTGVFMFATVIGQLFVPAALHRFGWGAVLVVGLALLGVPSLLHLLSADLLPVLAIAAVRGAGFAVLTVAGSSAVAELVEPARRGRAIGAFGLAIAGPQLVLLPMAPWVAEAVGYWAVFLLGSLPLIAIIPAVRLARHLHASHHDPGEPRHASAAARFSELRALAAPVGVLLGVTLAGGALLTFVPQLLDGAAAVAALAFVTATAAAARWLVGGLADRVGTHRLLWPFVLVTVAGLALVAWSVSPGAQTVPLLLTGAALVGLSYGGLQNLTLGEAFAVVPRDSVFASTVWNIGFDTGTGIGAVVVGALAAGFSFQVAFIAAAAIALLTLPLALLRRPVLR